MSDIIKLMIINSLIIKTLEVRVIIKTQFDLIRNQGNPLEMVNSQTN